MTKARFKITNNVAYMLRDKDGNVKKLFRPWKFVQRLIQWGVLPVSHPKIPILFGLWTSKMVISNVVVNTGKASVAGLINGVVTNFFEYIALGTDGTAEGVTDASLGAEITTGGGARAAATTSRITTDVTNDTAQLQHMFNFTASFAIVETGVFDSASAGTMLARQTFSQINVANGDSLQITWQFDVD